MRARPASIAPKYFYDRLGCALYGAICELPEYYPTRVERSIFVEHREAIARTVGRGGQFVDLGAGDCCKAESWLPHVEPARYLAVDIAEDAIARALDRLAAEFPEVELGGVVVDFTRGLDLEADLDGRPVTFFYPGSSIGNFAPAEAEAFLARLHAHGATRPGSGLLIGVDTKKDVARLVPAYADPTGVTAAFNRNVLNHVNRLLGCDFRPEHWAHVGLYDARAGTHRDAPRGDRRAGRDDRRRAAPLRGGRAHPHRELVQVRAGRVRGDAAPRGLPRRSAAGRTPTARSPCSTHPDASPARMARQAASRASRMPLNCQRASGGKKLR